MESALRREGLYHSRIKEWARARDAGALSRLAGARGSTRGSDPANTSRASVWTPLVFLVMLGMAGCSTGGADGSLKIVTHRNYSSGTMARLSGKTRRGLSRMRDAATASGW